MMNPECFTAPTPTAKPHDLVGERLLRHLMYELMSEMAVGSVLTIEFDKGGHRFYRFGNVRQRAEVAELGIHNGFIVPSYDGLFEDITQTFYLTSAGLGWLHSENGDDK